MNRRHSDILWLRQAVARASSAAGICEQDAARQEFLNIA